MSETKAKGKTADKLDRLLRMMADVSKGRVTLTGDEVMDLLEDRDELEANHNLLRLALTRLLEEDCPFECDTNGCECGPNGNGFNDEGKACCHIEVRIAIATSKGER